MYATYIQKVDKEDFLKNIIETYVGGLVWLGKYATTQSTLATI